MRFPKFTAAVSTGPPLFAYGGLKRARSAAGDSIRPARRPSLMRPFVVRVFGPDGAPLHGAEVVVTANNPRVHIHPKCRRGRTVNGLWQCYVPCSNYNPLNPYPSQILYNIEVWSVWGIKRLSWWQGTNSWVCSTTKDIEIKY